MYTPHVALVTLIVWIGVVLFTKYSSLGAIVSFALLPLNIMLFDFQDKTKIIISILISLFIIIRHKDNIRRLMKGTERKIGQHA
jgi:glycerol-3-phosphate acyltransferase PlsY